MKKSPCCKIVPVSVLLPLFFVVGLGAQAKDIKGIIRFASVSEAKQLLSYEDEFIKGLSQFDIDSRLGKTKEQKGDLMEFITSQARAWTKQEEDRLRLIFGEISTSNDLAGFKFNFPGEIVFVKTTGTEEGGAIGYTRANYVVLKEGVASMPKHKLKHIVAHELFHILSRHDQLFRKNIYRLIGFEIVKEQAYPQNLFAFRISNPDAIQMDSYITLKVKGRDEKCVMIIYSNKKYAGGGMFKYLNLGFMRISEPNSEKSIVFKPKQVRNFFEQVGKNTGYVLHPEEILAENFAIALNGRKKVKSKWLIAKIKEVLKKDS